MKIQYEIYPENWIDVTLDKLTDDHEENPTIDDPVVLNGSEWYLDGDYTQPPRPIRIVPEIG